MMRTARIARLLLGGLSLLMATPAAFAADRFFGFNDTTSTTFTGVYLAPQGTTDWGRNEVLNDKDQIWDFGERLRMTGVSRAVYDLKVVDKSGHVCIKHGINLTKDTTFDIRDADLQACQK